MKGIYSTRNYLAQYDLDSTLFENFKVKPKEVLPLRSVFIISDETGEKILKKVNYTVDELEFIKKGLNYVNRSFNRTINFLETKDNKPYVIWNDSIYCMMNLVEGRESDYSNPMDLIVATEALAELHYAGKGFYSDIQSKNNLGKIIKNFKRKEREMELFRELALIYNNKSKFNNIFIENADYLIDQIKKSIKILENSCYYKLCSMEEKRVFCHHDLAYHNIIINKDKGYFVDFDYAIVDLRVHDLCNFITKWVKSSAYDIEKCSKILEVYNKMNPLNGKEIEVLYGMLTFPQEIFSIVKGYYTENKNWSEESSIDKLKKKIDLEEFKEDFLKDFQGFI
ncbi:CotS family spore coat protein [Clostridium tetani]|uniref:CotS family spore coat protein n=1 Tax=Clostridium tetani TaxID=1513 RepID=UPI00100B94A8|nr:CotS family spore coat protein [Clostridium tetani]RXI53455.1 CotS family spore coat protein [Clostridium tetani]RXI56467.1 CotS family spore coat protein [Clostridium tetani]RXM71782.1 CotS family spore coat protein [Clostridium tetani]RXM77843.1 CotS family spore coat protein [Clostridium tetani]RYU99502.1 CotS family spore coat protein [Clostridium tetani]